MSDDDLTPDDFAEPATENEPGWAKALRERADKALKQKNAALDEARKARTDLALVTSGLNLPPERQAALLKVHDGEITAESLRQTAVAMGWAEAPPSPEPTQSEQVAQAQAEIAQATQGAEASATSEITSATIAGWSMDQRIAWSKAHPEEWEALKRGLVVTGVPI